MMVISRTMQAQERRDKKCFIWQSGDHLMRDHYKEKNVAGPLQLKGLPQNKSAQETAKASPPGWQCLREPLQSEGCTLSKSGSLLLVHRPQKLG